MIWLMAEPQHSSRKQHPFQ